MWAGFMRAATKDDKNDWYERPQGIVTANVCRLSGKRPADGCSGVLMPATDGSYTTTSTVYTEYFAKGTVPTEICPLHPYRTTIDSRTASWSGGTIPAGVTPSSSRGGERAAPATPATLGARADAAPDEEAAKEPEKKKRGFWSRIFGRGKDDDDDKKKKEEPRREQERDRDR
jgi:hypothetical protein